LLNTLFVRDSAIYKNKKVDKNLIIIVGVQFRVLLIIRMLILKRRKR